MLQEFMELLAERCEKFAGQVGVGSVETVGHLVSYLVSHPRDFEPWINGGFSELPDKWLTLGELTYHDRNGKVRHPQDARFSRIIRDLSKPETPHG